MLRRLAAGTLCALQLACGGPDPAKPTPTPSPTSVTLNGRLFDSATGDALVGANINIRRGENQGRFTSSDDRGVFTLADLTPGAFTIVLAKAGYQFIEREMTVIADTSV